MGTIGDSDQECFTIVDVSTQLSTTTITALQPLLTPNVQEPQVFVLNVVLYSTDMIY